MVRPPVGTAVWVQPAVSADWQEQDMSRVAFVDDTALYILAASVGHLLPILSTLLVAEGFIFRLLGARCELEEDLLGPLP